MQSVVRDVLVGHLMEVTRLTDLYQARDPNFAPSVLKWISSVEKSTGELRLPLAGAAAAMRGEILAVSDGYRRPELRDISARKATSATAAAVIKDLEEEMRAHIHRIDEQLLDLADRMAQLVAIASQEKPLPKRRSPREAWLTAVWSAMDVANGAGPIHGYLQARLSRTDRLYLLDSIMRNVEPEDKSKRGS